MASNQQNINGVEDRKISGFSKRVRAEQAGDGNASGNGRNARNGRVMMERRGKYWWSALLADLILLVLLVGLVLGGIFGYRALRDLYAPSWETREVVFCVVIEGVDPDMMEYGQGGRPSMTDHPIWSSDKTDADQLGIVTDAVLVTVDGINTFALHLTVEAEAYYREGKGYRMGETMLLAGTEGFFRMESMVAKGTIISMHEKSEETEVDFSQETKPLPSQPEEIDPNARG
ncbi:MAG: hypothetical protein IJA91_04450 [Clostridia bacterium]|nr:hypothetical protein [Clostridia bacterium]